MLNNDATQQLFFNQIEAQTAAARQRLEQSPAIARCLAGDVEMQTYQAFLIEAYHHVKHTVPLLMACGSRLPERLLSTPRQCKSFRIHSWWPTSSSM